KVGNAVMALADLFVLVPQRVGSRHASPASMLRPRQPGPGWRLSSYSHRTRSEDQPSVFEPRSWFRDRDESTTRADPLATTPGLALLCRQPLHTKGPGNPPGAFPARVRILVLEVHVSHAAAAHAAAGHGRGLLRLVGDQGLGGQEQPGDGRRVLERRPGHLGLVDDPELEHVS